MTKQGSHDETQHGDLLPVRQAEQAGGAHEQEDCSIVFRWRGCQRKARFRFNDISEICADHVISDHAVPEPESADAALEFGRFRLLPRRRQLVADGTPIELGSRAFDLLLALLEADGSLVTKDELLSRVWPGIFVTEDNLKVQIFKLRKALGKDRDYIRTEFGRGYRFTAKVRSTIALGSGGSPARRQHGPSRGLMGQYFFGSHRTGGVSRGQAGRRFDLTRTDEPAPAGLD